MTDVGKEDAPLILAVQDSDDDCVIGNKVSKSSVSSTISKQKINFQISRQLWIAYSYNGFPI